MSHTNETTVIFKNKSFDLKIVEDVDYLLGLVKTDDDVPFWAVLWPAAIGMSEYIWENIDFTGQRVLELGAGLGLVGLVAAAKRGEVVQTDFIAEALQLAQENAGKNGITNVTQVLADWRDFQIGEKFDWILGSDILYDPSVHPYLRKIFNENLVQGGRILLADPGRDDAGRFIESLEKAGWDVIKVTKKVFESGRRVNVSLYLLKPKPQTGGTVCGRVL